MYYLIAFALGYFLSRQIGNGFSVGGKGGQSKDLDCINNFNTYKTCINGCRKMNNEYDPLNTCLNTCETLTY